MGKSDDESHHSKEMSCIQRFVDDVDPASREPLPFTKPTLSLICIDGKRQDVAE